MQVEIGHEQLVEGTVLGVADTSGYGYQMLDLPTLDDQMRKHFGCSECSANGVDEGAGFDYSQYYNFGELAAWCEWAEKNPEKAQCKLKSRVFKPMITEIVSK